jgi:hypothetical protein
VQSLLANFGQSLFQLLIPKQDLAPANTSAFNKLTRTFAMQMEALKRYRSGAEQKVTLQHVSVAEGGQAIVGNVTQAPRENGQEKAVQEKAATPPPTLPDTNVVPMPSMGKSKEHDPLAVRRKSTNERRSQAQHGADAF